MTYVMDTNTISYFLRGEGKVESNAHDIIFNSNGENQYAIPYIVFYEVKRWLDYKPTKELKEFTKVFNDIFNTVENKAQLTPSVWGKAYKIYIALKAKGQLIGDADILIAAYCLMNDYTLVTRNTKDFERIEGLKLVNWFE